MALPACVFYPVERQFDGVTFPTVPASTLYNLQIRYLRPKDFGSVRALAVHLRDHPEDGLPESLYQDFRDFRALVERKYPLTAWLWKIQKQREYEGKEPLVKEIEKALPVLGNWPSRFQFRVDRTIGEITSRF